jgi:hypothetical protein
MVSWRIDDDDWFINEDDWMNNDHDDDDDNDDLLMMIVWLMMTSSCVVGSDLRWDHGTLQRTVSTLSARSAEHDGKQID